ncbi:Inosine/uridine-preferring nucleoside hydrolase [Atractiella rhizophila]|nr:Inosine/uridine-preferring nucleoside hydrolase [Atractiella rhizophila]
MEKTAVKNVWLDCDPGHDDALAILMALHSPNINLLAISTTHGNAFPKHTYSNALRLMHAFASERSERTGRRILCYAGASRPLLPTRPLRSDPEIHGADGLGGVVGLPSADAQMEARYGGGESALKGVEKVIAYLKLEKPGEKITFVCTGPLTNMAIFLTVHPELIELIDQIVFMGGGVGVGNRSPVAEYNILCDPEAAQIVLDTPVRTVMIPLNVTHKCIFHSAHLSTLSPTAPSPSGTHTSPLRQMLSTLVQFFAATYKSTFGFEHGPPVHDAVALAYVVAPQIFQTKRYRVDVELEGKWTAGETVVDLWDYRRCSEEDWGSGKNCLVAEDIPQVDLFFELLLACVERADTVSPLNVKV